MMLFCQGVGDNREGWWPGHPEHRKLQGGRTRAFKNITYSESARQGRLALRRLLQRQLDLGGCMGGVPLYRKEMDDEGNQVFVLALVSVNGKAKTIFSPPAVPSCRGTLPRRLVVLHQGPDSRVCSSTSRPPIPATSRASPFRCPDSLRPGDREEGMTPGSISARRARPCWPAIACLPPAPGSGRRIHRHFETKGEQVARQLREIVLQGRWEKCLFFKERRRLAGILSTHFPPDGGPKPGKVPPYRRDGGGADRIPLPAQLNRRAIDFAWRQPGARYRRGGCRWLRPGCRLPPRC